MSGCPASLDEVLAGVGEHDDAVEAVARVGARLIMQQALKDEVIAFFGRERYARRGGRRDLPQTATSRGR